MVNIEIVFETENKKINRVLNDGKIIIKAPFEDSTFEYNNSDGEEYKFIVVQFVYNDKVANQAFYRNKGVLDNTWLPCDGIKTKINDNVIYNFIDTEAFSDFYKDENYMAVSYVLGGGMWDSGKGEKYKKKLNVDDRIDYLNLESIPISFNDAMIINMYINYGISKNLKSNSLHSAFDFSNKLLNSSHLEYTPSTIPKATTRKDYEKFYKNMENAHLPTIENQEEAWYCNIL